MCNTHNPTVVDVVADTSHLVSVFSSSRVLKANFIEWLEVANTFSLLGIHPKAMIEPQHMDDNRGDGLESDSVLDYTYKETSNKQHKTSKRLIICGVTDWA